MSGVSHIRVYTDEEVFVEPAATGRLWSSFPNYEVDPRVKNAELSWFKEHVSEACTGTKIGTGFPAEALSAPLALALELEAPAGADSSHRRLLNDWSVARESRHQSAF